MVCGWYKPVLALFCHSIIWVTDHGLNVLRSQHPCTLHCVIVKTAMSMLDFSSDSSSVSQLSTIVLCRLRRPLTHTHLFNGPLSGTTRVSRYQKGKTNLWILVKQETASGSGISWAVCKSAFRSRQTTMPAPHHSVFLQAGCPSCHPTNSVKELKALGPVMVAELFVLHLCWCNVI